MLINEFKKKVNYKCIENVCKNCVYCIEGKVVKTFVDNMYIFKYYCVNPKVKEMGVDSNGCCDDWEA